MVSIDSMNSVKYNENITITGKFTDENNKKISNSNVKIFINNKKYYVKTDNNGIYNFSSRINTVGINNGSVGYSGNSKYNQYEQNFTFNVEKQDVIVTHNSIENTINGSEVTITGKFTDINGKTITNSNVKIIINNHKTYAKTDENGTYLYTFTVDKLGTNNVSIGYSGNKNYNPYEENFTFNVEKLDVIVTFDEINKVPCGENVNITGEFTEVNGKKISNSNVKIILNGKKYYSKTNNQGIYNFTIPTSIVGENNVTIGYSGNKKYNEFITNTTFNVFEKEDPDIRLTPSTINPGKTKTFFGLIANDATGTITLSIDDMIIAEDIEINYGQIFYKYTIPENFTSEKYILYLNYTGDVKYKSKVVNTTLTLTPEGGRISPEMNMSNFSVKYSICEKLIVNLSNDSFGNVTFEINNTNISETVNFIEGQAIYNYTPTLKPGEYTLIATYNGNYKYNPKSINSNIIINKLNSKITVSKVTAKAGNVTTFTAKIVNELGEAVENINLNFSLNDMEIGSAITDSEGVAKLSYKLPSSLYEKEYNIIVKSENTDYVLSSTENSTLKLKQLKTNTMVPNISTIPSKYITITATVVDEFNNSVTKGNVTFSKNNKTIATVAVDNGYAKYNYESNYETSSLTYLYAKYEGDWKYSNSKGNGTFKVTKLKTFTTVSSIEAKPNSEVIFTARIINEIQESVNEGNVTFSLDGNILGTVEVSKGNAKLRYTLDSYATGNYRIKCEYHESAVHKNSSSLNTMTVSRYETTMKGDSIIGVVGNYTNITLNVIDEEKYNVINGTAELYIENEYISKSNVSNGYVTFNYKIPNKYDGKIVKYYVTYLKNELYDSSSYSNTLTVSHQKIVYVSPTGSNGNLGDEKHPFKTLQYAINHITLFGTIYLDEGTYSASGIKLNNSISIIGKGRDKTIIDGLNSGKPIFNMSKRNVVLTLDNVTLANGKCDKEFSAGAIVTSGKLTITNSRFVNNTGAGNFSGGAIYTNGILNVTNTEFINNIVTNNNSQGGAIRTYDNITYITKCTFDSNKVTGSNTTGGSCIFSDSGDIIINATKFTKNIAQGKYITGGVIRIIYGALVIDNCVFKDNTIQATDYAIGGVIGSFSSGVAIINSEFKSNSIKASNSGGGTIIYIETAVLDIKNSKIASNKVTSKEAYGGTIYGFKAYIEINNTEFNNNSINATNGLGGVIYTYEGNLTTTKTNFTNNTIRASNMALAGAIYSSSNLTIINSNFIKNNINATNLGGGAIANMGILNMTKTNLIDNYAYNAGDAVTATADATNNINGNYWGSETPSWDKLLNSVTSPTTFSKTKINN